MVKSENRGLFVLARSQLYSIKLWLTVSPPVQLPRTQKTCPRCNERDAVYFQSQQRAAETGMVSNMSLFLALLRSFFSETLLCVHGLQSCLHCRLASVLVDGIIFGFSALQGVQRTALGGET